MGIFLSDISMTTPGCEESQSAVLQEFQDAHAEHLREVEPAGVVLPADVTVTGIASGSRRAGGKEADLAATTAVPAQTSDISFTGRGTRSTVGELRATWALGKVGEALGLPDDDHVTLCGINNVSSITRVLRPTVAKQ